VRCEYAGCRALATTSDTCVHNDAIVTWYFCAEHIHDHRHEWYTTPLPERAEEPLLAPCGTVGAFRRHKRRGEVPDAECTAASRRYNEGVTRLRREAAA